MKRPEDLVCNPSDLCGEDGEDDYSVRPGSDHRAAVQARYAAERGCDFGDVRCLRSYARIFTRQEVWDAQGRQEAADELNHKHHVGWYFERIVREPDLTLPYVAQTTKPDGQVIHTKLLPAGWYSDFDGETPAKGVEAHDMPPSPPPEWEPSAGMYCWTYCGPDDPGAVPIWECSPW